MSSNLWEVDPETRSKLLAIQKTNGNDKCCDCDAPSPQWASPKFGTFICLNCAGTHRGLGVHISFVRSITMDAFKTGEIQRMDKGGGNDGWKRFFDNHEVTLAEGRSFEDSTVRERYDGVVGEEWKERLSAVVEGREFVPGQRKERKESKGEGAGAGAGAAGAADVGVGQAAQGSGVGGGAGRKEMNEAYFARLGNDNASRPADLPPSEGGKYSGFGGGMPPPGASSSESQGGGGGALPGVDDFQKDPMAALTKGFGWFTTTVGKGAKTVNDSYLQPTAKQIAESEFASQARNTATHFGQNLQTGALGAAESFNRFVEGGADDPNNSHRGRQRQHFEPERKDFWDDFAALGDERGGGSSAAGGFGGLGGASRRRGTGSGAIGTSTMKKGSSSGGGLSGGGSGSGSSGVKKDGWDDDW